jgi:hypothetical protein
VWRSIRRCWLTGSDLLGLDLHIRECCYYRYFC